jgi:TATA-box binding protein (TBP) (component of TFIID and TFIIIB)
MSIAPEPEPLNLIIITTGAFLGCNINLELMAKQLVLDDQIVGKKLVDVISEGEIKTKTKHNSTKKKNRTYKREDFSNQCTVIVRLKERRKINLKIFGNGKIVITGGLTTDVGKEAVKIFKEHIKDLHDTYQIRDKTAFTDHFKHIKSYLKYINKNYLVFLKFFALYGINVNLRLDLILNKKFMRQYNVIDPCDPIGAGLLSADQPEEIDKYLRMIQVYNICHHYYTNESLLKILGDTTHPFRRIIDSLYQFEKELLPITFDREQFDKDFDVTIENYNTGFDSGFHIDREKFTRLLNDQYTKNGLIISAKFEPSTYQGIVVKYVSRVMCRPDCTSTGEKKHRTCPCKIISFFVFQEGKVIVTGGRKWEQMMDGYRLITTIMKECYPEIHVEKAGKTSSITEYPRKVVRIEDGVRITYLHIKKHIFEHPRNVFLLKKLGLLDSYLTP